MATRRKPLAPTVARGYGIEHKRLRARLLATYQPSQPCPRCGWPLGDDPTTLQLGHTDDRTGYTGLEHRACNIGASNRRRAAIARAQGTVTRTGRRRVRYTPPAPADVQPGVWVIPQRQHVRGW